MTSVRSRAAVALAALGLLAPAGLAGAAAASTAETATTASPAAAARSWHFRHLAGVWRHPTGFTVVPPQRVGFQHRTWRFVEEYDDVCYRVLVERDLLFDAKRGATIRQLLLKQPGKPIDVMRVRTKHLELGTMNYRYYLIADDQPSSLCPADQIIYRWTKVYTDRQRRPAG
jgi:hypothetical protein